MAHEPNEANPWHIRPFDVGGDQVCGDCIDDDGDEATPEIEESDDEEERDAVDLSLISWVLRWTSSPDVVDILHGRPVIWQPLENARERVGDEEAEDEFD